MSIQGHRCNQPGCDGWICFENADFNYRRAMEKDFGLLDKPSCDRCGKEFIVCVSHVLIEVDENDDLVDELPQGSMSDYDRERGR